MSEQNKGEVMSGRKQLRAALCQRINEYAGVINEDNTVPDSVTVEWFDPECGAEIEKALDAYADAVRAEVAREVVEHLRRTAVEWSSKPKSFTPLAHIPRSFADDIEQRWINRNGGQ